MTRNILPISLRRTVVISVFGMVVWVLFGFPSVVAQEISTFRVAPLQLPQNSNPGEQLIVTIHLKKKNVNTKGLKVVVQTSWDDELDFVAITPNQTKDDLKTSAGFKIQDLREAFRKSLLKKKETGGASNASEIKTDALKVTILVPGQTITPLWVPIERWDENDFPKPPLSSPTLHKNLQQRVESNQPNDFTLWGLVIFFGLIAVVILIFIFLKPQWWQYRNKRSKLYEQNKHWLTQLQSPPLNANTPQKDEPHDVGARIERGGQADLTFQNPNPIFSRDNPNNNSELEQSGTGVGVPQDPKVVPVYQDSFERLELRVTGLENKNIDLESVVKQLVQELKLFQSRQRQPEFDNLAFNDQTSSSDESAISPSGLSVEEYCRELINPFEANTETASPDVLRKEQNGRFFIGKLKNSRDGNLRVIPNQESLQSSQNYNHFKTFFKCDEPSAGKIYVVRPAIVEPGRMEGTWKLKENGGRGQIRIGEIGE